MDGLNGNLGNNAAGGINGEDNANRNAPLIGIRERLFHALFFRLSLSYARLVPVPVRRVIEFVALIKAVLAFFILIYVHITFIHKPTTCLSHLHNSWPRDGILRVEILRNGSADYSIENSYARERKIREQRSYEMNLFITSFKLPMEWFGDVQIESSIDDDGVESNDQQKVEEDNYAGSELTENFGSNSSSSYHGDNGSSRSFFNMASWTDRKDYQKFKQSPADHFIYNMEFNAHEKPSLNSTWVNSSVFPKNLNDELPSVLESPSEVEKLVKAVWPDDEYIVEFSLEYGFLRLSPKIRQKLNIPVKVVILNPNTDACFGDSIMRYILEYIIGYDDLLMLSIKTLAEKENDKGYLRNVVTGELYRFVSLWMSRASYISAFAIMLAFTLSISMLLRYSHHQIFMFIVNLLQTAEFNSELTVPAAPLFTVILALIGMEAIMSEFFNDSTTAFYIIIIVWIADQYEAICCQRTITKKHWMKFFYLYQFSFYAYHYRFNGQYSGLALVTSWLFIQHSMIYFFHHYELPMILRRYQLQQFLLNQQAVTNGNGDSIAFFSTNADINIINNNNDARNNNNNNINNNDNDNNNNSNVANEQFRIVAVNENGSPQVHAWARRFSLLFSVLRIYRLRFGYQNSQQTGSGSRSRNLTTRVIVTAAASNSPSQGDNDARTHSADASSEDSEDSPSAGGAGESPAEVVDSLTPEEATSRNLGEASSAVVN